MLIEVFYENAHVATVNAPPGDVDEALEYAFAVTQNVEGSWSRPGNPDYRGDRVQVIEPLPTRLGRVYGHRSSMVGDIFVTEDGDRYECAGFGFVKIVEVA